MEKNGTVFCMEGLNSRIIELIPRLDEDKRTRLIELCRIAEGIIGEELIKYLTKESNEDDVHTSIKNIVLTYVCDYLIFETYVEKGVYPDVLIGYSLGLNTALVCSKNLTFEGGIEILCCIKKSLLYASSHLNQDMAVIVGLPITLVEEMIHNNGWDTYISIGSINSEYTLLITGEKTYIQKMIDLATNEGALKAVMLNTFIAFHYARKEEWLEECMKEIVELQVYQGVYPVMSVYSLNFVKNDENSIKGELKKNVSFPMQWSAAIKKLEEMGYHEFWDVSLDGNLKKLTRLSDEKSFFRTYKSLKKQKEECPYAKSGSHGHGDDNSAR